MTASSPRGTFSQVDSGRMTKRNGVRFVIALALGLRQGEALGLKWFRLHEPTETLEIMRALQRRTWQHGCADPHACGAGYHKTRPCPKDCKRHKRQCPPPCPPDCEGHARWCPQRRDGGLVEVNVKSRAGRRGIALPDQLFVLIAEHRKAQEREREHAGTEWHEGGWMFTQPNGKPLDPRRDLSEWKALLREAGVRDARLHDARHTAATTLLLLGVPERAVMDMMGWSNSTMVRRYAHVTARLRRDIADRLDGYLWRSNETRTETKVVRLSRALTALCDASSQVRRGGQGRGRTADLPLFRRTLIPTELPDLAGATPG